MCVFAYRLPKILTILILFITKLFFKILTILMMCYLYKNPAPSSAMCHVLTCQCQGHLPVEIIPDA